MSEHRRKGPSRFGRSLALGLVTAAIFLGLILGGAAWAGWTVTNNGLSPVNWINVNRMLREC